MRSGVPAMLNESGLCLCGCGAKTSLSNQSVARDGLVKGKPKRFIKGHENRTDPVERFWSKVDRSGECHLWHASEMLDKDGYGQFSINTKPVKAHRYAWSLEHGPLAKGQHILHRCEGLYAPGDFTYRRCVRLAHLKSGDVHENVQDRVESGRGAVGERNTFAALTWDVVHAIRRQAIGIPRGKGKAFCRHIAKDLGVSCSCIERIVFNLSWKE